MSISATRQRPTSQQSRQSRQSVPWLTVVTLAAVMAYADGFWMTSLRGATGAIQRTQTPYASWLRESTLVLPVFVIAVLGALTLALHRFGPRLRASRQILATALLVVAGGTLAGTAEMTASSAYDYHLQLAQMKLMDSMRGANVRSSLAQQQQAALGLQVHAVTYGAVILLVTNLVLVGWVVAMRGGRLNIATIRYPAAAASGADGAHRSSAEDLRLLLAAGLTAGAVIHVAVIPEHFSEWAAAAVFFMVLATAELVIAAALLLARSRPTILFAAVAVSVGPLALWLYSRTLGMPFGPGAGVPEPIGLPDLATLALGLGTLLIAAALLRSPRWAERPATSAHIRWLALTVVIAVTAVGLAGSSLAWFNDFPKPGSQPSMTTTT